MSPSRDRAAAAPTPVSSVELKFSVEMICPYEPGMPISEVQRTLGLEEVTKLASNENPLGPSPRVIEALNRDNLDLHTYPDYDGWYLKRAVAERLDVEPESVVVVAGSSDLMGLIADAYLGVGTEALVSDICFPVYANVARLDGADVVTVPLSDDFNYDLERMLAAISPRTRVIFLATPNNPTGLEIPSADLAAFLDRVPENVLCVLDLAYHDYVPPADDPHPLRLLRQHANVLLLRTFSKVYGLAGLRVGYAVAAPDVISALDRVRIPFTTSTPAQVAGRVALQDDEHRDASVRQNAEMLASLRSGVEALGLRPWASSANFLVVDTGLDSDAVFEGMLRRGIVVRPLHHPRLNNCLRITTGTSHETDLAMGVLEEVLKKLRT